MLRADRNHVERLGFSTTSFLRRQSRKTFAMLVVGASLFFAPAMVHADEPPVANDDYAWGDPGEMITVDLLINDYGVEIYYLDPYSIWLETYPLYGAVQIDYSNGMAHYMPDPEFVGFDRFTYSVCDAYGNRSNNALVGIDVGDAGY